MCITIFHIHSSDLDEVNVALLVVYSFSGRTMLVQTNFEWKNLGEALPINFPPQLTSPIYTLTHGGPKLSEFCGFPRMGYARRRKIGLTIFLNFLLIFWNQNKISRAGWTRRRLDHDNVSTHAMSGCGG